MSICILLRLPLTNLAEWRAISFQQTLGAMLAFHPFLKPTCILPILKKVTMTVCTLNFDSVKLYIFSFYLSCSGLQGALQSTHPERWGTPWLSWWAWWTESRCTGPRPVAWLRWCWWLALAMTHAPTRSCCPLVLLGKKGGGGVDGHQKWELVNVRLHVFSKVCQRGLKKNTHTSTEDTISSPCIKRMPEEGWLLMRSVCKQSAGKRRQGVGRVKDLTFWKSSPNRNVREAQKSITKRQV